MTGQVARTAKCLIAHVTLVRIGAGVNVSVRPQLTGLGESLTTDMTDMRLVRFTDVGTSHVSVEMAASTECLVARAASVRLRTAVCQHVSVETGRLAERFTTHRAHVRSDRAAVKLGVFREAVDVGKRPVTDVALVRVHRRVDPGVVDQIAGITESLAAHFTSIGSVPGVDVLVYLGT